MKPTFTKDQVAAVEKQLKAKIEEIKEKISALETDLAANESFCAILLNYASETFEAYGSGDQCLGVEAGEKTATITLRDEDAEAQMREQEEVKRLVEETKKKEAEEQAKLKKKLEAEVAAKAALEEKRRLVKEAEEALERAENKNAEIKTSKQVSKDQKEVASDGNQEVPRKTTITSALAEVFSENPGREFRIGELATHVSMKGVSVTRASISAMLSNYISGTKTCKVGTVVKIKRGVYACQLHATA